MINGKPAFEVKMTSKTGVVDHYYFDAASGILTAVKNFIQSANGVQVSKSSFSDYREVDGILTPFSTLGEGTGFKQACTLGPKGGYNRKINAKIFEPSPEVLALVKKKKEPKPVKEKTGTKQE